VPRPPAPAQATGACFCADKTTALLQVIRIYPKFVFAVEFVTVLLPPTGKLRAHYSLSTHASKMPGRLLQARSPLLLALGVAATPTEGQCWWRGQSQRRWHRIPQRGKLVLWVCGPAAARASASWGPNGTTAPWMADNLRANWRPGPSSGGPGRGEYRATLHSSGTFRRPSPAEEMGTCGPHTTKTQPRFGCGMASAFGQQNFYGRPGNVVSGRRGIAKLKDSTQAGFCVESRATTHRAQTWRSHAPERASPTPPEFADRRSD